MINIESEKNRRMEKIARKLKEKRGPQMPIFVPTININIPIENHGEDKRFGYILDVDQKTYKIVSAKFYYADGENTYREVKLTDVECKNLLKYYEPYLPDIWGMFCNCVVSDKEKEEKLIEKILSE